MTKILRCPECGADESMLYAEQAAAILYDVRAEPSARDGIATSNEDVTGFKSWRLGCNSCGVESESGENWTEGWLVERDNDD